MKNNISVLNWRFLLISIFILICIIAIVFKILSIQISDRAFLQNEGAKRYVKYKNIIPTRGTIFDRNNFPLAVSIVNYDLYALKGFKKTQLLKVSEIIELDSDFISETFNKKTLLKKNISNTTIIKLKKLNLKNSEIEIRHSRHYPLGDQISTLIGFYGKDGAQEGLEKSYDKVLSGKPGKQKYFKNAKQEVISQPIEEKKMIQGSDIHLTIDATIQFFAYKHLVEAIKTNKAKSGTVIILDNEKGEILAMANYPSYNPNHPQREIQKNRALVDAYELGSVFKAFTFASALNEKLIKPETEFLDLPKSIKCDRYRIGEYDNEIPSDLTAEQIFVRSGNIGSVRIAQKVGSEKFKLFLEKIGVLSQIDFDIEEVAPQKNYDFGKCRLATASFGHGVATTILQLAKGYAILSNGGYQIEPTLIFKENQKNRKNKRILNKGISEQIVSALRKVVNTEEGTAKFADVLNYEIGGKTGTADQPEGGAYSEAKINTFASIFPTSNPQFVFVIMLDTPKKSKDYYYKYRHQKGGWKGTLYNTAGWTSVEVAGKMIDKIGPILATKYIEVN